MMDTTIKYTFNFCRDVLGKTSSISQFGEIQWTLVACYVVSFVIVFLVLTKGVASLGKVS